MVVFIRIEKLNFSGIYSGHVLTDIFCLKYLKCHNSEKKKIRHQIYSIHSVFMFVQLLIFIAVQWSQLPHVLVCNKLTKMSEKLFNKLYKIYLRDNLSKRDMKLRLIREETLSTYLYVRNYKLKLSMFMAVQNMTQIY